MEPALTMNDYIAMQPAWLRAWMMLLVASHAGALLFLFGRAGGRWHFRPECAAIVVSFAAAVVIMNGLFDSYGYTRLLGLAHLVAWTPAFAWVCLKRAAIGTHTWYGRYIHLYLLIAGASLVIDAVDVIRYALGETATL